MSESKAPASATPSASPSNPAALTGQTAANAAAASATPNGSSASTGASASATQPAAPAKKSASKSASEQTGAKTATAKTEPAKRQEKSDTQRGFSPFNSSSWLFEKWHEVYDNQLAALRENLNKWPGHLSQNMDQSKSAFTDATDNMKESGQTMSEGMRNINRQLVDYIHSDVNRVLEMTKALMDVKSVQEAVEIQSEFVQDAVQAQIQHAKEISELAMQTSRDSMEPFSEGIQNFYEKMNSTGNSSS